MLTRVATSDLKILQRLFTVDWPRHLVTYGLLDHFIDRFQKYPEWKDKVQFLKLKDSYINNGSFVFINGPHIYFDTFEPSPYDELYKIMQQIDFSQGKVFIGVRDIFRPFLEDLIRINFLEKTFDIGTKCMLMPSCSLELLEKYESEIYSKIPDGFYVDSLREEDIEVIDSLWPGRYSKSKDFLINAIKMNPSTGIYKNDGELIAWNTFLETGVMGTLQVKEEYQRREFATIVSFLQYSKVVKMGRIAFGHIAHQNDVSFEFSTKKNEGQWVGNNSWIGVKKQKKENLIPLWGHL